MDYVVRAWIFDHVGSMFTEDFDTIDGAEEYCENRGLELFKTERVYAE
jgi:hypothetical protein